MKEKNAHKIQYSGVAILNNASEIFFLLSRTDYKRCKKNKRQ